MAAAAELPEGDAGAGSTEETAGLLSMGAETEGSADEQLLVEQSASGSAPDEDPGDEGEGTAEDDGTIDDGTTDDAEGGDSLETPEHSDSELLEQSTAEAGIPSVQGDFSKDDKSKTNKNDRGDKKDNKGKDKVKLCHSNGKNKGWVTKTVYSKDAAAHAGFRHQWGQDIIPPFSYKKGWHVIKFPGQNWDERGQEIWNNDCEKPVSPPTISVTVDQCTVPGSDPSDSVWVSLANLKNGRHYTVTIAYKGDLISSHEFVAEGSTFELDMPVAGEGSEYTATVTEKKSQLSATTEFHVDPCPPLHELTISGAGDQCVSKDGFGTVLVTVGGLMPEGSYAVDLWFGDVPVGLKFIEYPESSTVVLPFQVKEFGDYTAEVRSNEPVMQPTVSLQVASVVTAAATSASVVFAAGEGCPVPVVPAVVVTKTTTPALAATGADRSPEAMMAGALFFVLGTTALLLGRKLRSSHSES
jgi:hypothetical protein